MRHRAGLTRSASDADSDSSGRGARRVGLNEGGYGVGVTAARTLRLVVAVSLALLLVGVVGVDAVPRFNSVHRVNVASGGGMANNESNGALAVSADGRYVAFGSAASNIIPGDSNGRYDIFWRDVESQATTLVSVSVTGTFTAGGVLNYVDMTPDGRYVVFCSSDNDFVASDTNVGASGWDVFRRDMVSGETTLVSTASDGTRANGLCNYGSISDDGRYVAYGPVEATNLFPGDDNFRQDCVLKDLVTGESSCISSGPAGPANNHSSYPVISGDGGTVAFLSYATNLVAGDAANNLNLFARDLESGIVERVDAKVDGSENTGDTDFAFAGVSESGRYVVFSSAQTGLVSAPVGAHPNVYLRDMESDETTLAAVALGGGAPNAQSYGPRISADGRFVSYVSDATNLAAADANAKADVFVRDMTSTDTRLVTLNEKREQLDRSTYEHALSGNGFAVAFNTPATNLLPPYSGVYSHLYLRVFGSDDVAAPVVSSDVVSSYTGTASVSLVATDGPDGVGVEAVMWKLDSNATQTANGDVASVLIGPGTHTLSFWARDFMGNTGLPDVASFTVAAVPTVSLTSSSKTLTAYGQKYSLTGRLHHNGVGLAGKRIDVQSSASSSGFAATSISATTAVDGTFSVLLAPSAATYYRCVFDGDGVEYADPAPSAAVRVSPVPYVGAPIAPSTCYRTRSYTVYGYLKPRHTSGTAPVRIYKYRYVSGRWRAYGYVSAKVSDYSSYSKYSAAIRLPYSGKWRLRAYAPADAGHAAAWSSSYDYVTVR